MALFGRTVVLELGQEGAPGRAFRDLRVTFRVKHTKGRNPSTGSIRLYNPGPLTIAALEGPLPVVRLKVGYGSPLDPPGTPALPRLIFQGSPVKEGVRVVKQGPDRILEIEAQDGGRQFRDANVDVTFATPTAVSVAFAAVAAQMFLPLGSVVFLPDPVMTQGFHYTGPGRGALDILAEAAQADWYIRDGVIFVTPKGAPAPGLAPLFSALGGNLIGSPTRKDKGAVEVRALLDASLRPGSPFVLVSDTASGTFVAGDVVFVGDSGFDTPFYVETVGTPPGT